MKTTRFLAVAVLTIGSALALYIAQQGKAQAQAPGITRTDLQRHDLSVPGREAVQVLVALAPGVVAPGTVIRAKRSSMKSKAHWSIGWTASRR